jgi:hypothetical protein
VSAALASEPSGAVPSATLARDPTVPPLAARAPAAPASGSGAGSVADAGAGAAPRHLMVLQGKPYVIERGWPRGVGDKLGEARIERIEAGSVWLRDASGTHKLSLYPGVEIHPSVAAPAGSSTTAKSSPRFPSTPSAKRARHPGSPATLATQDPLP